jgi:hypothetical protein
MSIANRSRDRGAAAQGADRGRCIVAQVAWHDLCTEGSRGAET